MDLEKIMQATVWLREAATASAEERVRLLQDIDALGLTRYDREIAEQTARAQ